jgi:hypothetical protein
MPPKPALESFASLEAYLEALVGWLLDQRFAAMDREWLRAIGVKPE